MSSHHVDLTDHQADFVRQSIDTGQYRDVDEVVGAALRLLEQQEAVNRLKLDNLRRLIQEGFDSIDRGEYETITQDTLGEFMESVSAVRRRQALK